MRIRLGSRGSQLARTQSELVADALRAFGHRVEVVVVRTEGDVTSGSLAAEGGMGLFAAALRRAVAEGDVDVAVHSLKDLPVAPAEGLVIAAIPERELPFDVLCARDGLTLADLPAMSRVGTGSPRRAAQLRARRPDLTIVEIRGNVGTRLARVHGDATNDGDLDAVVLARAGLARLGRFDAITDVLDLLPAPGQGALAVECRGLDLATRDAVAALDHADSRLCVTVERELLGRLGAGCAAPVGTLAHLVNGHLELRACVSNPDGTEQVDAKRSVELPVDPVALAAEVAEELLAAGAAEITPLGDTRESRIEEFHHESVLWAPGTEPVLVGRRVLIPRADGALADAVRAAGATVDAVPLTRTRTLGAADGVRPETWSAALASADWVVLSSARGVRALVDAGIDLGALPGRIAAVGPATAAAVESAGGEVALVPDGRSEARSLVAAFPPGTGRVVLPGSELAGPALAEGLRDLGWTVDTLTTYTTEPVGKPPRALSQRWIEDGYDAVVLTAGSNASAVVDLLGAPGAATRVVAFGVPSATAAEELGLAVDAVAETQDGDGLVAALVDALRRKA